jgi:hypothetical protein
MDLFTNEESKLQFRNTVVKRDTTEKEQLAFPEHFEMYISHLKSLDLLFWRKLNEDAIHENGSQTGTYIKTQIELTQFGNLFVKACIPDKGFIVMRQP